VSPGGVDLGEFRSAFIIEAEELLSTANSNLVAVEQAIRKGGGDSRAVRELFRAVHTIKGLASMVGIEPIVAIAHRLETALRAADRAGGKLDEAAIDVLVDGVRAVEQRVRAMSEGHEAAEPAAALLEALDRLESSTEAAPPRSTVELALADDVAGRLAAHEQAQLLEGATLGKRALRVDFTPSPGRAEAGLTITTVRARVAKLADIVKVVPLSVPLTDDAPGGLRFALFLLTSADEATIAAAVGVDAAEVQLLAAQPVAPPAAGALFDPGDAETSRTGVVRVEISRLDEAMERLSALVVTRFRLARAVAELAHAGANVRELTEIMNDSARQLRDLRAAILRVRMVRVAELFDRVPLLVRGLARSTHKKVRLQIDVGDAEVDKGVAERLFPALVHLIRNCIDHGLETPDERKAAGKAEEGTISIACFERTNSQLELTIADDGRGIDRETVARRAGKRRPDSDVELLELLCLPGLSTREQATTTSGRGMGMDIVRRTVEQLGGSLTLQSRPKVGTRFVIHVPLTISIIDVFTFECAGQRFVVPVTMVEEVLELEPAKLVRAPGRSTTRMFERRGETIPVVPLATVFGLPRADDAGHKALVVRRNGKSTAFAIDRVVGQQEVVVRPLEDALVRVPGVSGSTDLGDGKPTLVVDLAALSGALSSSSSSSSSPPSPSPSAQPSESVA
jgi:two-component system chemotaxis sensor kinase CheA